MATENSYPTDMGQHCPKLWSVGTVALNRRGNGTSVMVLSMRVVGVKAFCSCHIVTEPMCHTLGFAVAQGRDSIGPVICISRS